MKKMVVRWLVIDELLVLSNLYIIQWVIGGMVNTGVRLCIIRCDNLQQILACKTPAFTGFQVQVLGYPR
jgi:hypothetical protein